MTTRQVEADTDVGAASPPAARSLTRRLAAWPYLGPALVAGGALAATAYVALVDPNEGGHYPLCPSKALTGLDCPGCGGLRAVHALCHGQLRTALDQNLLAVVVLLPLAVLTWALWVVRIRTGRRVLAGRRLAKWGPYALLVLLAVFTVVRNLPGVPFLRSGIG